MDITSYLLGKKSSGGGGGLNEYFTIPTGVIYSAGAYVKKIPYDIDLSEMVSIANFFQNWGNIESITLKNGSGIINYARAFSGCSSLKFLDVRDIIFSTITTSGYYSNAFTSVPNNCLIIVKDSTEKEALQQRFDKLKNIKTVDEYNAS